MGEDADLAARVQTRIGMTIKGKYRLDSVLGVGGMAAVYGATHRNQAEFAVKMLHHELSFREDVRSRFLREGYAANSVKHPGVVLVVDDDVAEDGSAFLVMELLRGIGVEALWEQQGGRLPAPAATSIVDQLLDVLSSAHGRGIVHRDIKPANLFVTRDGTLKVLDFGIARARDAAAHATASGKGTGTGMLLGTPAFMAPEQAMARSSEIDQQTDVWAAAATLFTLVTGQTVHQGENAQQLLVLAATARARPLGHVAPHVPPPIARVVDQGLAFDKRSRWQTAGAMRDALRDAHRQVHGGFPSRSSLEVMVPGHVAPAATIQSHALHTPGFMPGEFSHQAAPFPQSSGGRPSAPPSGASSAPPFVAAPQAFTAQPVSATPAPAPTTSRRSTAAPWLVGGALAAVMFLVVGALGIRAFLFRAPASATVVAATSAVAADVPANDTVPDPGGAPAAPTVSTTTIDAATPDAASPHVAVAVSTVTPAHPSTTPVSTATHPPPVAKCSPPYYIDSKGNKVFKKECL